MLTTYWTRTENGISYEYSVVQISCTLSSIQVIQDEVLATGRVWQGRESWGGGNSGGPWGGDYKRSWMLYLMIHALRIKEQ